MGVCKRSLNCSHETTRDGLASLNRDSGATQSLQTELCSKRQYNAHVRERDDLAFRAPNSTTRPHDVTRRVTIITSMVYRYVHTSSSTMSAPRGSHVGPPNNELSPFCPNIAQSLINKGCKRVDWLVQSRTLPANRRAVLTLCCALP